MNKQAQDKRWSELSEESQNKLKEVIALNLIEDHYLIKDFEKLFGTHNLNPKQIKTWKDVEKEYSEMVESIDDWIQSLIKIHKNDKDKCIISLVLISKIYANLKIAKLIELGYGGLVTEEEYILNEHSTEDDFWGIWINARGEIECTEVENCRDLLVFHTQQQAEEFMSHESNRKLVEQYHLL